MVRTTRVEGTPFADSEMVVDSFFDLPAPNRLGERNAPASNYESRGRYSLLGETNTNCSAIAASPPSRTAAPKARRVSVTSAKG